MGLLDDLLGGLGGAARGGGGLGGPRGGQGSGGGGGLGDVLGDVLGGGGLGRGGHPTSTGSNMGSGRILMALLPVVLAMLARRGGGRGSLGADAGGGMGPGGSAGGGGLGDVLGGMLGGGRGAGGGGLGDVLGGMLGGGGGSAAGGLGGLLEQFQRAGLGKQAQSWVSTGPNEPLDPGAVEQVFGPGALGEISRQAGLTEQETAQGLAQLLPEVVDHVTPSGDVPDENALQESVQRLIQKAQMGGLDGPGGTAPGAGAGGR